jgi:hypothetical protein
MLETQEPNDTGRRQAGHDRWLGMQSAYAEYKRLSDSLESMEDSDDSSIADRLTLITLERRQQAAFEKYLDARLAYLEFRFDEANPPDVGAPDPPGSRSWVAFISSEPFLKLLAIALICTLAFSFVHEQRQVRNLELAQRELRTELNNQREAHKSRVQADSHAPDEPAPPPAARPAATPPKPAAQPSAKRPPNLSAKTRQMHQDAARPSIPDRHDRSAGSRSLYSFSLGPSSRPQAVGPIAVVVRSIDQYRKTASLSIVSDRSRLDVRRATLNQPLWIKYRQERVELRVERIAANRVDGHVIEYRDHDAKLTATLDQALRDLFRP